MMNNQFKQIKETLTNAFDAELTSSQNINILVAHLMQMLAAEEITNFVFQNDVSKFSVRVDLKEDLIIDINYKDRLNNKHILDTICLRYNEPEIEDNVIEAYKRAMSIL